MNASDLQHDLQRYLFHIYYPHFTEEEPEKLSHLSKVSWLNCDRTAGTGVRKTGMEIMLVIPTLQSLSQK
jgi:hypothetical protein